MAKQSILDEKVWELIPQEHIGLVKAIAHAGRGNYIIADETGVVVNPSGLSKCLKDEFASNKELKELGMTFVKPQGEVGHWELYFSGIK